MSFDLNIPKVTGEDLNFTINWGDNVFIMGANGTGKSSLIQWLYRSYSNADPNANVRWISAHRQNWFTSNTMDFSPKQRQDFDNNIRSGDSPLDARWKDSHANFRSSLVIYDVIDADNARNRNIANAYENHDIEAADTFLKEDNIIKIINELFSISNILIEISFLGNDQIVASKFGGTPYSIAELSDGERNAFLIAANVLTAKPNTLVLIDEPERHLHRSIISPFLTYLFSKRDDCAFIVSTHDVMLVLDNPSAHTWLVRGCTYDKYSAINWDLKIVSPGADIDDEIKKDIFGARKKILFVEGKEESLDKALYSLIFPNVSIIPKSNCWNVEHTVSSIRVFESEHWVNAFGIIDNDRRPDNEINELKVKGIYALSVISVESIYYHPHIQYLIAQRQADIRGDNASTYLNNAKTAAIREIRTPIRIQDLSTHTAEKVIRKEFFDNLPNKEGISTLEPINVSIDVCKFVTEESKRLENALDAGDLVEIISRYPVRRTPALDKIAKELKFLGRNDYQAAVLKLLRDESEALNFVRSLFGTLASDIDAV